MDNLRAKHFFVTGCDKGALVTLEDAEAYAESARMALLEALKRLTARLQIIMSWPDGHFSEELPVELKDELLLAEAAIRKAEGS